MVYPVVNPSFGRQNPLALAQLTASAMQLGLSERRARDAQELANIRASGALMGQAFANIGNAFTQRAEMEQRERLAQQELALANRREDRLGRMSDLQSRVYQQQIDTAQQKQAFNQQLLDVIGGDPLSPGGFPSGDGQMSDSLFPGQDAFAPSAGTPAQPVRRTFYSQERFGEESPDYWTERGFSSSGQNLAQFGDDGSVIATAPGTIASHLPPGTIVRDESTGVTHVVTDTNEAAARGDQQLFDIYAGENYRAFEGGTGDTSFTVLGRGAVPRNPQEANAMISELNGGVNPYESPAAFRQFQAARAGGTPAPVRDIPATNPEQAGPPVQTSPSTLETPDGGTILTPENPGPSFYTGLISQRVDELQVLNQDIENRESNIRALEDRDSELAAQGARLNAAASTSGIDGNIRAAAAMRVAPLNAERERIQAQIKQANSDQSVARNQQTNLEATIRRLQEDQLKAGQSRANTLQDEQRRADAEEAQRRAEELRKAQANVDALSDIDVVMENEAGQEITVPLVSRTTGQINQDALDEYRTQNGPGALGRTIELYRDLRTTRRAAPLGGVGETNQSTVDFLKERAAEARRRREGSPARSGTPEA